MSQLEPLPSDGENVIRVCVLDGDDAAKAEETLRSILLKNARSAPTSTMAAVAVSAIDFQVRPRDFPEGFYPPALCMNAGNERHWNKGLGVAALRCVAENIPPAFAASIKAVSVSNTTVDEAAVLTKLGLTLPRLSSLDLRNNRLTSLTGLRNPTTSTTAPFSALSRLVLAGCRELTSFEGIEVVAATLTHLDVSFNTAISSLLPLAKLVLLEVLNITSCRAVTTLEGAVNSLARLEELRAADTAIAAITPIRDCRCLRLLVVASCAQLTSLDGVEGLAALEELHIADTAVTSLARLSGCRALQRVFAAGLAFSSFEGVEDLPRLEAVYMPMAVTASVMKGRPSDRMQPSGFGQQQQQQHLSTGTANPPLQQQPTIQNFQTPTQHPPAAQSFTQLQQ